MIGAIFIPTEAQAEPNPYTIECEVDTFGPAKIEYRWRYRQCIERHIPTAEGREAETFTRWAEYPQGSGQWAMVAFGGCTNLREGNMQVGPGEPAPYWMLDQASLPVSRFGVIHIWISPGWWKERPAPAGWQSFDWLRPSPDGSYPAYGCWISVYTDHSLTTHRGSGWDLRTVVDLRARWNEFDPS